MLKELEARFNALNDMYETTNRFVETINTFLVDKRLSYGVATGFKITSTKNVDLEPRQLSSGEQQLFLLFCHVLVSRDRTSLFIIDEPEISLNIKWQRRLVQALLDITTLTSIQFLFASHSIELLALHSDKVVKLSYDIAAFARDRDEVMAVLPADSRLAMRGHDLTMVLSVAIRRFRGLRQFADPHVLERVFVHNLEKFALNDHPLFKALLVF